MILYPVVRIYVWPGTIIPWNRLASISVGLPFVGTGVKKALYMSFPSYFSRSPSARLFTLPAARLRRLPLRLRLPVRLIEFFFFSVPERDGDMALFCEAAEPDRRRLFPKVSPSTIEEPRRVLASNSSLKWLGRIDCDKGEMSVGAPSVRSSGPGVGDKYSRCPWSISCSGAAQFGVDSSGLMDRLRVSSYCRTNNGAEIDNGAAKWA